MSFESKAHIRIIQVTDIYTLANFPSLKTLIEEKKAEVEKDGGKTISMLTGDFLAPYLLSSFDKGAGMMSMLNKTPIDYVIWGNHEHDLSHEHVMKREKEYKGVWINSNMQSHESFADSTCQVDAATVEVLSPDGSNTRKLGMIGVLSSSPSLYKPGAFGGAVIEDPWECLEKYNKKLKDEGCDMVLPLCHLYEFQDEKTCMEFDFPVILSGHDHHKVDRIVSGTRLLKPGMDGHYAVVLDLVWDSAESDSTPTVEAITIPVADFEPDPALKVELEKAYGVLKPLLKTELATIPQSYSPLTSLGPRERRVTMATYLLTQLRHALNLDTENYPDHCDCVIVKGGNIRGERDYNTHRFSLEGLRSEMQEEEGIHIFLVPGRILRGGLRESWTAPGPGWMQYDDGVEVDSNGFVVKIGGAPLDPRKNYRVGSFIDFNTDYGTPTIHQYFEEHKEGLPDPDAGIGCHVLLLKLFSKDIWNKLWLALDADGDGTISSEELKLLDIDGDGMLSKVELKQAIERIVGLSTFEGQDALVDMVMAATGDVNDDAKLTVEEINAAQE